jgi:DNA-binding CsgD family transcriptional regulator
MTKDNQDYSLFYKFIETYLPTGFKEINRNDPLILEIEELTQQNNQFFIIVNLIELKIIWVSHRSMQMFGITPEEFTPYHFFEATHPDDLKRHTLGRAKMLSIGNSLFTAKSGTSLFSTNIRIRNFLGEFRDILFQLYFFYSELHHTVFLFLLHTDIDTLNKRKNGYHYYIGDDLKKFRFPDEELLMIGSPFTDREFEIIMMIEQGLNTEQIAEKLSLSVYTVNTHRGNILKKTEFKTISDLILHLHKHGILP